MITGNDVIQALAVSDSESGKIYIYDGKGDDEPIHVLDKIHSITVKFIEACFSLLYLIQLFVRIGKILCSNGNLLVFLLCFQGNGYFF